ncbi:MAG: polysaccharide deacetylase [Bacteroidetes bacterium]|nr:polysaccharide deacetylase [Bacteroidota bacterium]
MPTHLVCLTFDFDAMSSWISRKMTTPTPISRGEFGVVGAGRMLSLLGRYGIGATWFIPGHTCETYPDICRRIHAAGHEIGNHGYAHEPPATLSPEQEEAVLLRGNEAIRRITGADPKGYRSPSWDLSPHTVSLLLKHGFVYDSSMMGHDYLPYRCRQGDVITADGPARLGPETALIEMPISWSLDDHPAFEYLRMPSYLQQGLRRASDVMENWVDDFRYMAETTDWGVLTYTFHPQIVGRGHRMLMLERLVQTLGDMGATFIRLDAAAEESSRRSPFAG